MQNELCMDLVNLAGNQTLVPTPQPIQVQDITNGGYITYSYSMAPGDETGTPICGSVTIREQLQGNTNIAGLSVDMTGTQQAILNNILAGDIRSQVQQVGKVEDGRSGLSHSASPCFPSPSRPGEFHPEPLTDPDVRLSPHPARATHRRLAPSGETAGFLRSPVDPTNAVSDPPPSLHGHYPASSLLWGGPRLTGPSVLSASRVHRLSLFPQHGHPGSQVPYESPDESHAS